MEVTVTRMIDPGHVSRFLLEALLNQHPSIIVFGQGECPHSHQEQHQATAQAYIQRLPPPQGRCASGLFLPLSHQQTMTI